MKNLKWINLEINTENTIKTQKHYNINNEEKCKFLHFFQSDVLASFESQDTLWIILKYFILKIMLVYSIISQIDMLLFWIII